MPFFEEHDQHDLRIFRRRITGKPGMRPRTFVSPRGSGFAGDCHWRIRLRHASHAIGNRLLQAFKNWRKLSFGIGPGKPSETEVTIEQLKRGYADAPFADGLQL